MKKSLLALAALGAFAGSAQAQSSVTVYGIVDVGFLKTDGTTGANNGTAAANGGKTVSSAFNSGNLATSRLGFRGIEDIGGGTRASFVLEIGLTPTSNGFSGSSNMVGSPLGSTYPHNSNGVDNRQSFLGLAQKGFGEARIGRQLTPVHEAICAQNVGQCNNMAGDMIYMGGNSSNTRTVANSLSTAAQVRASNAITFRTENIQGFQVTGLYSVNSTDNQNMGVSTLSSQSGQGAVNYRMHGGNISFTGVKNLDIRFGTQYTGMNRDNASNTTTANVLVGNQLMTATPATFAIARSAQRDQYAGISYDFGVAKVALQQAVLEVEAVNALTVKRTANQVAVSAPVTKTINAWASYGQGKYKGSTAHTNYDFSGYQAGAQYSLSKRTSLYAIYGVANQDAQTAGNTKYQDTQYAIGARHSF
jgi:predicted porin